MEVDEVNQNPDWNPDSPLEVQRQIIRNQGSYIKKLHQELRHWDDTFLTISHFKQRIIFGSGRIEKEVAHQIVEVLY